MFKGKIPEEFLINLNFKEREEIMKNPMSNSRKSGVWRSLTNLFFGSKSK